MRWGLVAFLSCLLLLPRLAEADKLPTFGIGVNSSLMAARTFGEPIPSVSPGVEATSGSLPATGTGTVSFRVWATERFAIEPNIGVSLRDTSAGTIAAVTVGLRALYAFALKKSFRANVGLDAIAPIITGGGSGTSIAPAVGPLVGVEYFFDEERTFSFEVYIGMPVILPVDNAKLRFDFGGNVMAGFHFYLW
jgi:hypothetical protein